MRIAVTSKSGKEVDQHFGHAERFLVYEVGGSEGIRHVETIDVEKYCAFNPENPTRQNLLEKTISSLKECQVVVTAMIGEAPRMELEKVGIKAICAVGPIEQALCTALHSQSGCSCTPAGSK